MIVGFIGLSLLRNSSCAFSVLYWSLVAWYGVCCVLFLCTFCIVGLCRYRRIGSRILIAHLFSYLQILCVEELAFAPKVVRLPFVDNVWQLERD